MVHITWRYVRETLLDDDVYSYIQQNAGNEIKWAYLITLHEKTIADSGLYIGRKLMLHDECPQVMLIYITMFMFLPYYMTGIKYYSNRPVCNENLG